MNALLLAGNIVLYVAGIAIQKVFTQSIGEGKRAIPLFAAAWTGTLCLLYAVYMLAAKSFALSDVTLYAAIAMGLSTAVGSYTALTAFQKGPLSLTMLIISMCVVIPVILSVAFLGEGVTHLQWIGFVLILVVFVLANGSKDASGKKVTLSWFLIAVLCCLANGAVMFASKIQQTALVGQEIPQFMALSYLIASAVSLLLWLYWRRRDADSYSYTARHFYLPVLGVAVGVGGSNLLNVILSAWMPSVILFPTYQCSSLILSAILSFVVFRERGTARTYISVLLGAAAVVVLNL